jgi:hypothetical protein
LGQDAEHGIREAEGVATHVEEAGHSFDCAVGVQGAHDQVTGERRFDPDFSRFLIAHFAHHDHVWVGSKECAHGLGKRKVDLRLYLDLSQSILGNFDGVFCGPDLDVGCIDMSKH